MICFIMVFRVLTQKMKPKYLFLLVEIRYFPKVVFFWNFNYFLTTYFKIWIALVGIVIIIWNKSWLAHLELVLKNMDFRNTIRSFKVFLYRSEKWHFLGLFQLLLPKKAARGRPLGAKDTCTVCTYIRLSETNFQHPVWCAYWDIANLVKYLKLH